MLNNWPMGFYHPATLVKDAQRHGLRVLPVDVTRSEWRCTVEEVVRLLGCYVVKSEGSEPRRTNNLSLRLGLRFVSGLREEAAQRIVAARTEAPFESIADVAIRADLRDDELQALAHTGAFAPFGLTRREAMWQAAAIPKGPLLRFRDARRGGYENRSEPDSERDGSVWNASRQKVVSRSAGLATGNAIGARVLSAEQPSAQRGAIRSQQSDATRSGVGGGQHRGRKREGVETGLRELLRVAQGSLRELETYLLLLPSIQLTSSERVTPLLSKWTR